MRLIKAQTEGIKLVEGKDNSLVWWSSSIFRTSALHKRTRCAIARFTHYIRLSESNKRFETSTSLTLGSPTPVEPHWWQRWDLIKSSWTSDGMLWIESSLVPGHSLETFTSIRGSWPPTSQLKQAPGRMHFG